MDQTHVTVYNQHTPQNHILQAHVAQLCVQTERAIERGQQGGGDGSAETERYGEWSEGWGGGRDRQRTTAEKTAGPGRKPAQ